MKKSITDIQKRSDDKRGVKVKSIKLHVDTISLLEQLAECTDSSQAAVVTNALHQYKEEHMKDVEQNLRNSILRYEELCDHGSAQGNEARAEFIKINNALRFIGKEYDTLTLARYGSKRAIKYISEGCIPGYSIDANGSIVKK